MDIDFKDISPLPSFNDRPIENSEHGPNSSNNEWTLVKSRRFSGRLR